MTIIFMIVQSVVATTSARARRAAAAAAAAAGAAGAPAPAPSKPEIVVDVSALLSTIWRP